MTLNYLLRCVLKVTPMLGRDVHLRVAQSWFLSHLGQNQITLSSGISSIRIFNDLVAFRTRRAASWPRGAFGARVEPFRATASPTALTKP